MTFSADFSAAPGGGHAAEVERLCDAMEAADQAGRYPRLTVERPWSVHNPVLEGEFASPKAIRWYLERELTNYSWHVEEFRAALPGCTGPDYLPT